MMPAPASTCFCGRWRSLLQTQRIRQQTVSTPQIALNVTAFTVSNKKKPAVNSAASSGHQDGPGMVCTYCGSARELLVINVSRAPVAVPGRK